MPPRGDADDQRAGADCQREGDGIAGAVDNPCEHFAAQIVRAEEVLRAGRQQPRALHLGNRLRIGDDHIRQNCQKTDQKKNTEADHGGTVFPEPTHNLKILADALLGPRRNFNLCHFASTPYLIYFAFTRGSI